MKPSRKGEALAQLLHQQGIKNQRVLDLIACTPRELFMPDALRHQAYHNTALPIGQGQTISQPYTVARMTELILEAQLPVTHILEIGTGSGYQTAVLAQLFKQVSTIERIKVLQFQAKRRLNQLHLFNVAMKHGDGWNGWSSKAPYDAIIVTAAAASLPISLTEQLNDNGRLVIPVGDTEQKLNCIDKVDNELTTVSVEPARFVPLVAGALQ